MRVLLNSEFLRRLALVAGLFLSIMMYTTTVNNFFILDRPDFKKMQQVEIKKSGQHEKILIKKYRSYEKAFKGQAKYKAYLEKQRSLLESYKKSLEAQRSQPLDQYIDETVKGKIKDISGPKWDSPVLQIEDYFQGRTPGEFQNFAGTNRRAGKHLIFSTEQGPFAGLARQAKSTLFLSYDRDNKKHYLRLVNLPPRLADKYVKDSLRHPFRAYFWAPFVLGLALYLFIIPKVKRPEGALGHPRLWGVMISDFFGLLFSGLFFLFGFLLMVSNHVSVLTFSGMETGPKIGVIVLWVIGILCLWGTMWFGISYRNFWIRLLPLGMEEHTQSGTRFYAYADMKQANLRVKDYTWMAKLALLLSVFSDSGTTAMAMSMDKNNTAARLVIEMKDDGSWLIKNPALIGGITLAKALRENGVPMNDKLAQALKELDREEKG